jgi:hypothetical protein
MATADMNDYEVSVSRELFGSSAGLATEAESGWSARPGCGPLSFREALAKATVTVFSSARPTAVILAGGEDQRAINSVSQFIAAGTTFT